MLYKYFSKNNWTNLVVALLVGMTAAYYAVKVYGLSNLSINENTLKTEVASINMNENQKLVINENQIKDMKKVDFEKIGTITVPFPQTHIQLPYPWIVIKQVNMNTFILVKDPFRFMVPNYLDKTKKSFVLWSLIDGTEPECFVYSEYQVINTTSDNMAPENNTPVMKTMSASDFPEKANKGSKSVRTAKKTTISTSIDTLISDRDELWKKELSFLFPFEETPLQSPQDIARFIKNELPQICEKQSK